MYYLGYDGQHGKGVPWSESPFYNTCSMGINQPSVVDSHHASVSPPFDDTIPLVDCMGPVLLPPAIRHVGARHGPALANVRESWLKCERPLGQRSLSGGFRLVVLAYEVVGGVGRCGRWNI